MLKAFKRKIFAFFIAYVGKYLIRTILATCQVEVRGLETFKKIISLEKCMLMVWHNRLTIVSEILFKVDPNTVFAALISKSRDGDPVATLASSYATGKAIRVPHDRRHHALKNVIKTLKATNEVIIITPDGPRGPRYVVKAGIAVAAKETKASIIPFTWASTKFWQLKSWDKLLFPKPFSKIIVTFGDPIFLLHDTHEENQAMLGENLLAIEQKVNESLFSTQDQWPK